MVERLEAVVSWAIVHEMGNDTCEVERSGGHKVRSNVRERKFTNPAI